MTTKSPYLAALKECHVGTGIYRFPIHRVPSTFSSTWVAQWSLRAQPINRYLSLSCSSVPVLGPQRKLYHAQDGRVTGYLSWAIEMNTFLRIVGCTPHPVQTWHSTSSRSYISVLSSSTNGHRARSIDEAIDTLSDRSPPSRASQGGRQVPFTCQQPFETTALSAEACRTA